MKRTQYTIQCAKLSRWYASVALKSLFHSLLSTWCITTWCSQYVLQGMPNTGATMTMLNRFT